MGSLKWGHPCVYNQAIFRPLVNRILGKLGVLRCSEFFSIWYPRNGSTPVFIIGSYSGHMRTEYLVPKKWKSHWNVCFSSDYQATKLWILMEYLGGGSALDLMKAGKFSEIYIATILREILKGLDYLHSEGKMHRDIKGIVSSLCGGEWREGHMQSWGRQLRIASLSCCSVLRSCESFISFYYTDEVISGH